MFAVLASFTAAEAKDAFVVDVVRTSPYDRISVSAAIKGAFTKEIKETIDSGTPTTFTYFLQLKRHRMLVWNETEREVIIKRMVKYDTLKKEYLTWEKRDENENRIDFKAELAAVEYNDEEAVKEGTNPAAGVKGAADAPLKPVTIKDPKELERWMTHLEKIDLGPVEGLKPQTRYYARVRCEMKSIKLIPPFNYILFFLALWDFDTDWSSSTPFTVNIDLAQPKGKQTSKADIE